MAFSEFRGNPQIVTALRGAFRAGRVPHALLFTGPQGVEIGADGGAASRVNAGLHRLKTVLLKACFFAPRNDFVQPIS